MFSWKFVTYPCDDVESSADDLTFCPFVSLILTYMVRGIITGPASFKQHNLVNIRFIYMKISDNVAEGMPSLQIWK